MGIPWELNDEEEMEVRIAENSDAKDSSLLWALIRIIRQRSPRRPIQRSAKELFDIIMRASDIRVSPEGLAALKELVSRLEEHDAQRNLD